MASQTSGILRWTCSIKDAMTNDPGRQFFEDQVQSQGFLFLEEYLDNIWAAAKQDSFVDLVKTPGRKRASPQKVRQAIAAHTTSKDLSDEKDVFQSADLRLSAPPPLTTTIEPRDYVINPPPQAGHSDSPSIQKTADVPQPMQSAASSMLSTFVDMSVPLKEEDTSALGVRRNPSLSQFPSLAAPSPLRKSMRIPRESSLEPSLATTPGTGLTVNHTSWLAKVREAKAMEVTNKRASVAPASLVASSGSLKRKSGDIPNSLSHDSDNGEEPRAKILKTCAGTTETSDHLDPQPLVALALQSPAANISAANSADVTESQTDHSETDMMAPLKKAIETLRARTGKPLAANLTEVVAQEPSPIDIKVDQVVNDTLPRPHTPRSSLSVPGPIREAGSTAIISASTSPKSSRLAAVPTMAPPVCEETKRLSVSDLVPKSDRSNATSRTSNGTTISTTPPDSPPATKKTAFFVPGGPVFNKPPPVFVPPPPKNTERLLANCGANVPQGHPSELPGYSLGAPFGLGLQPTKFTKSPPRVLLSAQSTQSSLFSDKVFESQTDVPAWVTRSQDTQITSQESQPVVEEKERLADIDDDDSWRIDDKFAATNQLWTPFTGVAAVEDSMTWSTEPSDGNKSTRQDPTEDAIDAPSRSHGPHIVEESDQDMDVDDDMEKVSLDNEKPTANSEGKISQLSLTSSTDEPSQPVGFFGHATKLVSSMLGVSKKNKVEAPKSIQLAAAVAKKQQDELDRKAARLKEMEARRQAVLQKKVEEEKARADEEERKAREDAERRKKENTGKRPLARAESKPAEDENTRKRKVNVEVPKVKPPSKEKKDAPVTRITKPGQISGSKATTMTKQPSTTSLNQATNIKAPPGEKPFIKPAASAKGKGKVLAESVAAHAHPQRLNAEPPIASEMIELPEPNSEYSDSEDEGGQRKANAPEWTQSPELRAALESQSRVNPDDIFGPVRPLRMEDIFRTRTSRFRARTSSANWSGPDGLKQEEEREYARRMGFH
ncbi:hypothetical protein F5148DRAFT_1373096 [Russula earlei]|uniref:Uncharacterized protein n=1 Tax=Russula earlei TaxID=71964 RepID=A0ACC0ULZ5_9AGAM|nr:hypothetical protein F5148DRAFT_1373096 [Russula earlei]